MISIEHAKLVAPEAVASLRHFFAEHNQQTRVRVRESGVLNTLEWAIPALVTIWITKSFFDGFLKELGKDSATSLKAFIRSNYSRLRGTPNRAYNASELRKLAEGDSPDSVGRQGPVMKIVIDVPSSDGSSSASMSFIIPDGFDDIEIEVASSTWADNIGAALDRQSELLNDPNHPRRPVELIYDREDGWLEGDALIAKEAAKSQGRP